MARALFPFASQGSNVVCAVRPPGEEFTLSGMRTHKPPPLPSLSRMCADMHLFALVYCGSDFFKGNFATSHRLRQLTASYGGWIRLECWTLWVLYGYVHIIDWVRMCFGLWIHPWHMAPGQPQADNILKETLQHYILTSTDSSVYSNQCHNRWRGMNLWQADIWLWFLMPRDKSRGTDSIKAFPYKKIFIWSRERTVRHGRARMLTHITDARCLIYHY